MAAGTCSTIGAPLHNVGTVDGKVGELRLEVGTGEPDTGTFTGADAANRVVFVGERTFTGAVQLPGTVEIADALSVRPGDTLRCRSTVIEKVELRSRPDRGIIRSRNEVFKGDFHKALGAIKALAYVMPGQTDLYFPPEDSAIEVKHMPNAKLIPMPSIWGHFAGGPGTNPEDVKFLDNM